MPGMMEPQAQQLGINMTFPRFDNPFFVSADRTRLKQIVINLLSNAIKIQQGAGNGCRGLRHQRSGTHSLSVKDKRWAGLSRKSWRNCSSPSIVSDKRRARGRHGHRWW